MYWQVPKSHFQLEYSWQWLVGSYFSALDTPGTGRLLSHVQLVVLQAHESFKMTGTGGPLTEYQ